MWATCHIELHYADKRSREAITWIDTIRLIKLKNSWLITDVSTGADWALKRQLTQTLQMSIQTNRSCKQ